MRLTIDESCKGSRHVKPQLEVAGVDGDRALRVHFTKLVHLEFEDIEGAKRFALRILGVVNDETKQKREAAQLVLIE